jgi:hypothetical protein
MKRINCCNLAISFYRIGFIGRTAHPEFNENIRLEPGKAELRYGTPGLPDFRCLPIFPSRGSRLGKLRGSVSSNRPMVLNPALGCWPIAKPLWFSFPLSGDVRRRAHIYPVAAGDLLQASRRCCLESWLCTSTPRFGNTPRGGCHYNVISITLLSVFVPITASRKNSSAKGI